ncbi:MAG: hypothetical protein JRI59_05130 [Deltaproteobacteria bacterium]|nr:hypothetical protein [Deltaproteobacteria bacterium]
MLLRKALTVYLTLVWLGLLVAGCAGKNPYLASYDRVQEGISTKRDVLGMYGEPKFVQPFRDGSEQWTYDADASSEFVHQYHTFSFRFNKDGVVISKYKFTSKWP